MNNNIANQFSSLLNSKTKERQVKRDAQILMDNFLSEIERLYKDDGLNRKDLAQNIDISESYISQVFNGKKPLNFVTLAKIKRALKINFDVTARFIEKKKTAVIVDFEQFSAKKNGRITIVSTTDFDGLQATGDIFEEITMAKSNFVNVKEANA